MKQFVLISLAFLPFFTLFAQTGQQGDWEFVPLTGGHVSFFVPNPFNENDLFAVAESPHIFYSSDRGRNWRNISGNLRDVMSNGPTDLAVTENGWIYLTGCQYSCLIRSTDWGETWEKWDVAGADTLSTHSTIFSTEDGRLWLFNLNKHLAKYSDDFGISWTIFDTPLNGDWRFRNISFFPSIGTFVALGRSGFFGSSIDTGQIWTSDTTFDAYDHVAYCSSYEVDGQLIIYLWAKYSTRPVDPKWLDYYESEDTGKTWNKKNIDTLFWDAGLPFHEDNSRPFSVAYKNGSLLSVHNNQLYRSYDRGVTWHVDKNTPSYYDIYIYNDTLFTSMPMLGIVRSIDAGRTWFPVESLGEMALFRWTELQVVDGFACALVTDGYTSYKVSTDNGDTWEEIFDASGFQNIVITTWPEPRYTMIGGGKIINGTIWQSIPDTVLHEIAPIVQPLHGGDQPVNLISSPAHPGLLYLVARSGGDFWLYHSLDGGQTWNRNPAPPYEYMEFAPKPSRTFMDRFVAIATPRDNLNPYGAGIWYAEDYGETWTLTQEYKDLNAGPITFAFMPNDVLFTSLTFDGSSDYGSTWKSMPDGIDPLDVTPPLLPYETKEISFVANTLVWYFHNGTRWQLFGYTDGTFVDNDRPQSIWYVDNVLWTAMSSGGFYRIVNPVITGVRETPVIATHEIDVYPNPFATSCSFTFNSTDRERNIIITNILGKVVFSKVVPAGETRMIWNGRGSSGENLPEGMYFIQITSADKPAHTQVVKIQ